MNILFQNGQIFTMNSAEEVAEALLIQDNKIAKVGTEAVLAEYIERNNITNITKFDLAGKALLPGLIDTHTHFFEIAKAKNAIDLSPATTLEEVAEILSKFRERMPEDLAWVGGSGWNKNIYPSLEGFNKQFLDEIFPDIPVSLESKDFHSKWCNSLALKRAGIDKNTPDPEGGAIGRFADGEPDGFTYEKAWELIDKVVPAYPPELALKAIKETIADCYKLGLTGVHVLEGADKYAYYEQVIEGGTKFRFCWHFPNAMLEEMISRGVTSYSGCESLKIGGQKIFMDGALGSQTALMYEPYTDTNNYGTAIYDENELFSMIKRGAENKIASSIHAIGDKCSHQVISAIAKCRKIETNLLHRIEHLQCVRPEDYPALKENNIYVAMQPIHMRYDIKSINKLIESSEQFCFNIRDLLDLGIHCGFGSDAPVEIISPFQGIYAAVARKSMNDPAQPSWRPEQAITVMQALKAYTSVAAQGSASEHLRGQIKEGYLADLIVIDDFTNAPAEFWLTAKPYLTMIDGKVVYQDE